ncbi:Re/Si-specific NAD(P)(+) transhydrogenase subunit alpha [Parafilimonas terrae]|uniref:NAD(P) transhydrogenase subunit alpha part 1 n=1 Tax=Parafilimonas terrae TaxID=1465490 RepID=A0A1I5U3Z7_9BACT|nr:Re/Si-specific NAD(P)(+) transhydrogenase subunit alpha [Parafilimonas terrae]SFP89617.1 NAD(P) transhydrogenase subunit alpha [Parafilimonas terrae]
MTIAILKEPINETRVSLLPEAADTLTKQNIVVNIEKNAGALAYAPDELYQSKNIRIAERTEILNASDIILTIQPLSQEEITALKTNAILIGIYQPLFNYQFIKQLAEKNITAFSLDMMPRTTRAQSMDVLSSQANIAGYKAVLEAANIYPRYFPMFMTAAGSIKPARVLILGAGVAGLQAIATARRLGAVVEVFDTRPAVKEEVMSLGAKFIEVEGAADASKAGGYAVEQTEEYKQRQQQKIAASVAKADIIITTAQIPGRKAPVLITNEMLDSMKPGSIIIDLAAATGGNTLQTKNNETVKYKNITIVGNSNLAATMPGDASKLYGKNVLNFLQLIITKEGNINLNFEDDIVAGCCITHGGKVVNERVGGLIDKLIG